MKRPTGVTILAVIAIIYGIFSLLLALLGLLGSALLAANFGNVAYSAGTLAYATISDAVLGILYLAFGIGAFRLKGWAWTVGIVALVLDVVRQIVGFVIPGIQRQQDRWRNHHHRDCPPAALVSLPPERARRLREGCLASS